MRTSFRVMMRQLAIMLLSACLVILPMSSAQALGFGNIRIKSALNEPLDAEIDLLSATAADLKGLKIRMASREAFLRAGIERPEHLAQLKFEIKRRSNDRAYLKISTKQSIREPFLDFLLEMNWKNGRMLREYTVLLDPPDRLQQQPTIVESPQTEVPAVVAEQEQQQTETPFVEPEPAVLEEARAEPEAAIIAEPAASSESIITDSIAAADVEEVPVPLVETVPDKDLQLAEEEPALTEQAFAGQTDEQAAVPVEETIDDGIVDPFAGEKFPRIPIKLDRQLRKAEEAELAALGVEPGEPSIEQSPLAEESIATAEPITGDAEPAPLAEQTVAGEELVELAEEPTRDAVDSVTTKRNDKLWNIARSMQPDESVSIYQVMMALLQSNPEAFIEGNVHRLKVGKVLRIDDPSMLSAMSKSQAAQEYIVHTQAWENYRQQIAGTRDTPMQAEMAGDIEAPVTEVLPEETPADVSGELVLAAPEGDNQNSGATASQDASVNNEVVILREEICQALTEAEAEGNKNIILNEKLRDLESQLQDLQRSVTVQDDELATLQKQLSDLNKKNIEAEQADVVAPAPHMEIPEVASTPESTTAEGSGDPAVMSEAELLAQSQQTSPADQVGTETTAPEQAAPAVEPPADTGPGTVENVMGVFDKIKRSLSGIVSSLPVSPLILAIGGGVIVVLLLLMLLLVQRRRQAANFQESILSGIPSHEIMGSEEASLETNLSGESSFLSDFAISGASALQGDDGDVDPLTEADVFMAYGRYEAAEERILEAIKNDPDRKELRIKLLELYNTTKNKSAFEAAAADMYANLGNDNTNPLWQKVVVMGSILAPENPLFNEVAGDDVTRIRNKPDTVASSADSQDSAVEDLGLDLDFAMEGESDEPSTALDFDFDAVGEETAQVAQSDEFDLKLDADGSLQFDTSGLDFELPTDETAEVDSSGIELDTSIDETAQTEVAIDLDTNPATDDTAQFSLDDSLDLDMSGIENDATAMDINLDDNNESSMGLTLDMEVETAVASQKEDGLTMEMSQPTFGEIEMPTVEAEVDATDMSDLDSPSMMDEVGTKLDLAKAYIDMGDPDGARSILDEVLEEGTPPQQQEAQALMQQI